ncbi:uncharacterized protein L3040_000418 [Drepanopeziza brunnea f. sp. 'multigermtubi']|uniref:uncharacterized protein n=1 Tax=Drepanopeziza brunnea f. sp. 'multigermtubi' TaxID=698441 RepID=UPI0023A4C03E|nr:hypothetical protein L3040_000418 [Drepanopeziza brunnea f. sp. 'multigermtubi']
MAMAKEMLDSDRVNYLIWRYLVESDYSETAVQLQKEWNIQNPQQHFDFAPHVQNYTLVSVLNRGLLYNVQEREAQQPLRDASASPAFGFFGPLMLASPPAEVEEEEDHEILRKRQIENNSEQPHNQPGPPIKRPRLSNGYGTGFDSTPMDVDDDPNGDENAYPSPEQLPSPVVATVGPEIGTQVEKVNELTSSETYFLELSDNPSARNVVLLQCEFNPQKAELLAAAGTDALARMWTLPPSPDSGSGSESPGKGRHGINRGTDHQPLLDESVSPSTTVTGLAWSPDGEHIAVASEPIEEGNARIEFFHRDGSPFHSVNGFDSPVICLRWSETGKACLAISPQNENKGTVITIMYPLLDYFINFSLPQHILVDQTLDAAWKGDDQFFLCGGSLLQQCALADRAVVLGKKFEVPVGEALCKIAYDHRSGLVATASESGTVGIWNDTERCKSFDAHQGVITSILWQPRQFPLVSEHETARFLATAGDDGAISIWNVYSSEEKSVSSMTMGSAVVALSFTPDGAFIAGGTNERILIWKTDDVSVPRAIWIRGDDKGWRTPQSQDSVPDDSEDQFSMCWDAKGQRLAYGVNSRLAVINFRR